MPYRFFAEAVVVVHFAFILFAVFGAPLVLRWKRVVWLHAPVVVYAALIEFFGWTCPLTPLENWFRWRGGSAGYPTSFTEHYILPLVYPAQLTYRLQIVLGIAVLSINLLVYGWLIRRSVSPRD